MKRLGALVIAVALLAAGCSTSGSRPQVTVFAAASLGEAFKAMPKPFAQGRDDSLTFSFAGSQQLVAQLQQGAKADAVATADRQTIERVPQKGRSSRGCPSEVRSQGSGVRRGGQRRRPSSDA